MTQRIPIPSFPYSNLHYSYINPASSYRNRNVEKRQRQKDNYADLYLEKKNFVTYEIDPTASGRFGHSCDNFRPKRELNSNCDIISKSRGLHRNNSYSNVKNDSNNLYMKTLKVLRNRRCSCECHRKSCNCHANNTNRTINEERMNNNKLNNSSNMKGNNILVRTHSKLLNRRVPKREDIKSKGQKTYVTDSKKGKSLSLPQSERGGIKNKSILKKGKQTLNGRFNEKRLDLNLVANSSHPINFQRGNENKENIIYNDNNSNYYKVRNQRQNDYMRDSSNNSNEGSPIQNDVHNNEYESRLREIRKQYKDDGNYDNTNDNSTTFKSTMKSTMRNYKSPSIGNVDQYSKEINDEKLQSHNSAIDHQQSNIINQIEETMISPRFPEISSEDKESNNRNTKLKSKQKQTFSFKGNNSQPSEKELNDNIDEYNSDNENINNEYEDVNTPQSKVRLGISEKISPIKNQKSPLESSGNKEIRRQIAGSEIERLKRLKMSIQKSSKLNKIKDKASLQSFEKDFKNAKLTSIQQKLKKLSRSSSMKNIDETKFQEKILNYNKEDDFYQEKGIYKKDILGDMLTKIPHHGKYLQTKASFGMFNQFSKENKRKGINLSYSILNNSSLCEKIHSNYNSRYGSVMPANSYGSVLKAREFFFFND